MMRYWFAAFAVLIPMGVSAKDKPAGPPVPVCIVGRTADAGGFTVENAKDITDSVNDLRAKMKSRKSLVLVEANCPMTLTVTDRKMVATGAKYMQSQGPYLPAKQVDELGRTVFFTVVVGEYTKEMTAVGPTWMQAADRGLKALETWVEANRDRISGR